MIKIKLNKLILFLSLFLLILSKKSLNKNSEGNSINNIQNENLNDLEDAIKSSIKDDNTKTVKKKYQRKLKLKSKSGEPLDLDNLKLNMKVN